MDGIGEIKVKVTPDISKFTDEILDQLADKIVERLQARNPKINVFQNLHTTPKEMAAALLRRGYGIHRNV